MPQEAERQLIETLARQCRASVALKDRLEQAVHVVGGALGARACAIYLLQKPDGILSLGAFAGEEGPGLGAASSPLDEAPQGGERPGESLAVAIREEGETLGAVEVQARPGRAFGGAERALMEAAARGLVPLIREAVVSDWPLVETTEVAQDARERYSDLSVLYEIGKALSSTLELGELLALVARLAATVLMARGCVLRLLDPDTGGLPVASAFGLDQAAGQGARARLGEGVAGIVAREGVPLLIPQVPEDPRFVNVGGQIGSCLVCVPLVAKGEIIGTISVFDRIPRRASDPARFSLEDLRLLSTLASQAAIAIENARLFREADRLAQENLLKLREISILNEIAMAMQGTMNLNRLLHVILTGVTFGGGLGFNRALLLLVHEQAGILQGVMGVGPASGEEAARVWAELTASGRSLRELINERASRAEQDRRSPFDQLAKGLRIPLREEEGVLALTALTRRPHNVTDAAADPRVRREHEGQLDVQSFAAVPLVAKDRVVGVMVVDNKYTGRPITAEDLKFLSLFAHQAGLAIESAQTYTRLEEVNRELQRTHHQLIQQEKLAALGEMAAQVVHEIRNPLVSIGGFARRLARRLLPDRPEGRDAQVIAREVDRLERIVEDIRGLTKEVRPTTTDVDCNQLLRDCLILFEEKLQHQGVGLDAELQRALPPVRGDGAQIKQAVLNLIYNALEAMPQGGTLRVRTRQAGDEVQIEVEDSGGGIPQDILDNIFNPFFTTKDQGTGLGLPLVHKILRGHGGRVDVENRPGKGALFRLSFPRPGIGGRGG